MWLNEYHMDGLRVDSTIYMRNTEGCDNDPEHDIADRVFCFFYLSILRRLR